MRVKATLTITYNIPDVTTDGTTALDAFRDDLENFKSDPSYLLDIAESGFINSSWYVEGYVFQKGKFVKI